MATVQNLYTGDGSTVLFSFTFPYIDEAHINVSVDGVDTTEYTLANATTVEFNVAPSNGAAIRIYRVTPDETTEATFFTGSAIRASDLNDNFEQLLFVAQESSFTANAANDTANDIAGDAATALATANTALATANAAKSTANGIAATAAEALSTANAAEATANGIAATANTALSTANSASAAATNAVNTANAAQSTANGIAATAAAAAADAAAAQSTANSAATAATAAQNAATAATADNAVTTPKIADSAVTSAKIADSAVTSAKIADGTIVNADINSAAGIVDSKLTGTTCKAWVNFNGTGTVAIRASYNVSSITDNGVGDYTVNFTTALADANYAYSTQAGNLNTNYWWANGPLGTPTVSAFRFGTGGGTPVDLATVSVAIFR